MTPDFSNTEVAFRYKSNSDLKRARFLFSFIASAALTKIGIALTHLSIRCKLPVKRLIKHTIFRQFCGGETLSEAALTARVLGNYDVGTILDYGVEAKENEAGFDTAAKEFLNAIYCAASQEHIPFISIKLTSLARFALLAKVHAGHPLTASEYEEWKRVQDRLNAICKVAAANGIMVLIDAEETWIQNACNKLTDAMMEKYNIGRAVVFNTFQLYCHGTLAFLKDATAIASQKGYLLGAKLVRGAYMEKEQERAIVLQYPDPIQPDKASTDKDFDEAVRFCLDNLDKLSVFIGTHNEHSCGLATQYMEERKIAPDSKKVFFSQLFGMSDNLSFNLAKGNYHVSKFLPFGPVEDVIPYLLRRAQENTSVAGQTSRELQLLKKEINRRGI
jgi:proline dehydrogenase